MYDRNRRMTFEHRRHGIRTVPVYLFFESEGMEFRADPAPHDCTYRRGIVQGQRRMRLDPTASPLRVVP